MPKKTYKTEDGHTKTDCPICEGEEHVYIIEEDGMCETCFIEQQGNVE